ncbi:MAG TPA: aspartate carbamoyltransferase [Elusimicrobiales bacterium]|nr:aspartate carbamoyltransferase [Elusimicrobiales bacterium]HOL62707.1 aspartate carbamoyltransferase [Elusimicrobiales bacterium]HPO94732.1 aspartate carbamoyltransferase [Elusimicrobiales bacterium]
MERTKEMTVIEKDWGKFVSLPISDKLKYFSKNSRIYDCLFAQQFDREILEYLFRISNTLRRITKTKEGMNFASSLLDHKRAILYFVQPSTRTFLSFLNACHILGIKTSEIRDTSISSEYKGESPEDSIRTFSSYVDLIIMRYPTPNFVEKSAWLMNRTKRPVPVINAGSSKDQHPTQALLDIYTLYRSFNGEIDGKTIAMVGDLKRGRTVRSLSYLMKNYKNMKLIYISPKEFAMEKDIIDFLKKNNISYYETTDFEEGIKEADAIYMTRIQDEHDKNGESKKVDYSGYCFKEKHLKIIKKDAIIIHPLPRRDEIDVKVDDDPRAMYWRQERNGMWVRAALMAYIFNVDSKIHIENNP